MVSILLALALPLVGSFVMFALKRRSHNFRGLFSTLLAFSSLILILYGSIPVMNGETLTWGFTWFPQLGINVAFMVDGLSLMFLILISGIGTLVCIYAIGYLHNEQIDVFFWFSLLLFMGAMLGVVISADVITLLIFWEMTSISSFLLIGINYWKPESRRGALNALFITAGGGLCLLAGVLLLASHAGTFSIIELTAHGLSAGPVVTTAMILILLGAWTKSAHFPFQFWLPQAMAAPTPISAYLHSATMVKAGIYLIARFNPVFAGHPYWGPLIMIMGLITFTLGGIMAVSQEDAKALLAYSTISQLGMITFMIGIGTEAAMLGAMFHILAHATFKGALFMGAGAIDHTLGTRRLDEIGPLKNTMPIASVVMALCSLSMAGVIPFSGFVSKEAMFEGILHLETAGATWWLIGSVVASIFTFLYSMRFVIELPFGSKRSEEEPEAHHVPHGLDRFCLLAPPVVLCVGTIGLGVGLSGYLSGSQHLINAAITGVGHALAHGLHGHLALWHGLTVPLGLTAIVVTVGLILYALLPLMRRVWREIARIPGPEDLNRIFQDNLVKVCHDLMDVIVKGPLNKYLRIMIGFATFLGIYTWVQYVPHDLPVTLFPQVEVTFEWLPFLLVVVLGLAILRLSRPVPAVIALGSVGFVMSTIYLVYVAPDLILTQIAVETVSVVIFLWVLKDIDFDQAPDRGFRGGDFLLALVASTGVCYFLLTVLETKEGLTIPAKYYIVNSLPEAWGHNMVNVILVDFRALDTMGEISVLGIATVGVLALLKVVFERRDEEGAR